MRCAPGCGGLPAPSLAGAKLAGADLEGWLLRGLGPTQPLDLRGADLSGTRLNRARVEFVDLAEADLTGAQLRQALFLHVSAPRLQARGSDWRAMKWREGSLEGAELREARLAGSQWLEVERTGARLPEGGEPAVAPPPRQAATLSVHRAHSTWVKACAWSPDGQRFVSGAADATLKVWDAASGTCLLTLSGHVPFITGAGHPLGVNACAWSPDGSASCRAPRIAPSRCGTPRPAMPPHPLRPCPVCLFLRLEPGRPAPPVRRRGSYPQGVGRHVRRLPPHPLRP